MKRTPLWVFVAAVGIQIAALGLCLWAMEDFGHLDGDPRDEADPAPAPPRREALSAAPEIVSAEAAFARPLFGPPPIPAGRADARPQTRATAPEAAPDPAPRAAAEGLADLRYVTEAADDATQIVHGESDGRVVAFGFYSDGDIRFVDVDGGRYSGKADSARARMREEGGTRAFTVQIGIAADGRLQATFTGGLHDSETLPLEPLVGWSIA